MPSAHLFSAPSPPVSLDRRLGGPQNRSGRFEANTSLCQESNPYDVSLVCNKLFENGLQERDTFEDLGIDSNTKIV